ncbi:MAG TPA: PAS domain S-box protein [Spirochaetota bacterium]|nr:PAS domain S-box protein [Spirochaetota bacterium]HOM08578.1 PAS domain S-box protein [Spirochaetota bacterium]
MSTILVIDDKKDNLVSITALLKNLIANCEVVTAQSGKEGIEKAEKHNPDVIILDIKMPEMDGYEVCQILKNNPKTRHIPVIFLTAIHTDTQSKVKGLKLGADAFLTKPVDQAELIAQINAMIRIKHAEDMLRKEKDLLEDIVLQRTSELLASQMRYKSLFNSISDMVIIHRRDGKILEVNNTTCDRLGFSHDAMMLMTLQQLTAEGDSDRINSYLQSINETADPYETSFVDRNGTTIPVEIVSTIIYYLNENAILSVARDITERKHIEHVRNQLSIVLDKSDDAIIGATLDGKIASWNKAAQHIFGYAFDEVVGCDLAILSPPYRPDEFDQLLLIIKNNEAIDHYETEGLDKKGAIHNLSMTISPLVDEHDSIIGCSIIARDFTDVKRTQEKLKKGLDIIQNLEDIAPAYFITLNEEGNILTCNKAMLQATGYSLSQVQGKTCCDIFIPDVGQKSFRNQLSTMKRTRATRIFESPINTKSGEEKIVQWHARPVYSDTEFDYFMFIGIDITEKKQLEKKILQANLEERNRIARDLHDGLGQHLAGIIFKTEMLRLKIKNDYPQEANEIVEIQNMVHQAIEQTRLIARGLSPVDLSTKGLYSSLQDMIADVNKNFAIKTILEWNITSNIDEAIDTVHVYYIIREALNNAVKHASPKNIAITISEDNAYYYVKIMDDGKGIPDEIDLAKGMGMHIMQYRAWIINASFQVQNNKSGGTLVQCIIQKSTQKAVIDKPKTGKKYTIVIVDDHPIVRQGLQQLINTQKNLEVIGQATSADEAIDVVNRKIPDCIIVDISLNGTSGIELVKALKQRFPKLPALVLSMYDEKLYAERAIKAGARGYLMKQEAPDKIIQAIYTVLKGDVYLSSEMKEQMVQSLSDKGTMDSSVEALTNREFEIFQLIGHGLGNKHIAQKLHISVKTVENVREKIKMKLHLETSQDLLQYAIEWVRENSGN